MLLVVEESDTGIIALVTMDRFEIFLVGWLRGRKRRNRSRLDGLHPDQQNYKETFHSPVLFSYSAIDQQIQPPVRQPRAPPRNQQSHPIPPAVPNVVRHRPENDWLRGQDFPR